MVGGVSCFFLLRRNTGGLFVSGGGCRAWEFQRDSTGMPQIQLRFDIQCVVVIGLKCGEASMEVLNFDAPRRVALSGSLQCAI